VMPKPVLMGGRLYFGCWDCNFYCLDLSGKLVWKFPTSISTPSTLEQPQTTSRKTMEVIWTAEPIREEGKYKGEKDGFSDYGEFSGTYISKEKSDYVSSRRKGYIK
jgi:outer membrane protein assembly factor BamB